MIDSDRLSHEELREPEVVAVLKEWWGPCVSPTGSGVDRRAVASIVFNDREQLARLEALLYPRLARRRAELLRLYRSDPSVRAVVLDAPKLYEAGLHEICDVVVFVDADRALRMRRLKEARGWTAEELARRENLLEPLDKKRKIADYTIVNHSSTTELQSEIQRIFSLVLASSY